MIDFQIVSHYSFLFQSSRLTRNFKEKSKCMENERLKQLCQRNAMQQAEFYVHDSDLAAKETEEKDFSFSKKEICKRNKCTIISFLSVDMVLLKSILWYINNASSILLFITIKIKNMVWFALIDFS